MFVSERDPQSDILRYELKLTSSKNLLGQIHSWVNTHPRGFFSTFPARWINNIYFDSWDMDSFNDHLAGISTHKKLRFRWYGEERQVIPRGYLELKQRSNRVGKKSVQSIDKKFDLNALGWTGFSDLLRDQASEEFSQYLLNARPVLFSRYYREYFATADQETRLTLDYSMQAFDQRYSLSPNLTFSIPLLDEVIIEVKSALETHSKLADMLTYFPIRVDKNSKYIAAIESILN